MLPRIGFALLLSCAGVALAGEVYTWKDASGRTHFSDKPQYLETRTVEVAPPPVAPRKAVQLAGTWQSRGDKNGRTLVATVTFGEDQRFSGQVELDGQLFMSSRGDWRIDGDQLHWTYTETSIPLPESLMQDTDTILAASADHLELLSSLSGEVRVFTRVVDAAPDQDG